MCVRIKGRLVYYVVVFICIYKASRVMRIYLFKRSALSIDEEKKTTKEYVMIYLLTPLRHNVSGIRAVPPITFYNNGNSINMGIHVLNNSWLLLIPVISTDPV